MEVQNSFSEEKSQSRSERSDAQTVFFAAVECCYFYLQNVRVYDARLQVYDTRLRVYDTGYRYTMLDYGYTILGHGHTIQIHRIPVTPGGQRI